MGSAMNLDQIEKAVQDLLWVEEMEPMLMVMLNYPTHRSLKVF